MTEEMIETDVLVIGGSFAGLFAANKARDEGLDVTLVDKNYVGRSGEILHCDCWYQAFNPEWGHDLKSFKDQISRNVEYLNNPEWDDINLKESWARYQDLLSWGVNPPKGQDGKIILDEATAMSRESIWIGRGGSVLPPMRQYTLKNGVRVMDRIMIIDLIKQDGRVVGAVGFHSQKGDFYIFKAKAVVICTGGGTFKPNMPAYLSYMSFDGESMAYRAGLEIAGKEFAICEAGMMVFYEERNEAAARVSIEGRKIDTSCVFNPLFAAPPPLIRGWRVDSEGYRIARGTEIMALHEGRGPMLMDLDPLPAEDIEWMTSIFHHGYRIFKKYGLDPWKRGLWAGVHKNEHGIGGAYGGMAGIESTDFYGATSLAALYAAGDAYYSAAGANYGMSGVGCRNAAVTGARAGQGAAKYAKKLKTVAKLDNREIARLKNYVYAPIERKGGFDTKWVGQQIQNYSFPYYIFYVRHGDRLKAALTMVEFLRTHIAPLIYAVDPHGLRLAHECRNRILNQEMMLRSAIMRTESRGLHYREEYPRRDDPNWLAKISIQAKDGGMKLTKVPIPKEQWPDLSEPYTKRYPYRFKGEGE